jgi:hypothetical protein
VRSGSGCLGHVIKAAGTITSSKLSAAGILPLRRRLGLPGNAACAALGRRWLSGTVAGRPQQADCVKQAIAQRLAAGTLLCLIGLRGEATRTHQPLKEPGEEPEIGTCRAARCIRESTSCTPPSGISSIGTPNQASEFGAILTVAWHLQLPILSVEAIVNPYLVSRDTNVGSTPSRGVVKE